MKFHPYRPLLAALLALLAVAFHVRAGEVTAKPNIVIVIVLADDLGRGTDASGGFESSSPIDLRPRLVPDDRSALAREIHPPMCRSAPAGWSRMRGNDGRPGETTTPLGIPVFKLDVSCGTRSTRVHSTCGRGRVFLHATETQATTRPVRALQPMTTPPHRSSLSAPAPWLKTHIQ